MNDLKVGDYVRWKDSSRGELYGTIIENPQHVEPTAFSVMVDKKNSSPAFRSFPQGWCHAPKEVWVKAMSGSDYDAEYYAAITSVEGV